MKLAHRAQPAGDRSEASNDLAGTTYPVTTSLITSWDQYRHEYLYNSSSLNLLHPSSTERIFYDRCHCFVPCSVLPRLALLPHSSNLLLLPSPSPISPPACHRIRRTQPQTRAPHNAPRAKLLSQWIVSPPRQHKVCHRPRRHETSTIFLESLDV